MNFELFNSLNGAPDPSGALSLFPALTPFYQALGNTPLQPVPSPAGGDRILAKYEFVNPFGSVKDCAAFGMFCEAINQHDFSRGPLSCWTPPAAIWAKPWRNWASCEAFRYI